MIGDLYYIISSTQQVLADYMPTISSENLTYALPSLKLVPSFFKILSCSGGFFPMQDSVLLKLEEGVGRYDQLLVDSKFVVHLFQSQFDCGKLVGNDAAGDYLYGLPLSVYYLKFLWSLLGS